MKISEVFNALENGKRIRRIWAITNSQKEYELVKINTQSYFASWWKDEPTKVEFNDTIVFCLGDKYEIA